MKDFMKTYKKKKIAWNVWIVLTSLVLAFWINLFALDWTNIWASLKASVIDTKVENKADLYLEVNDEKVTVINSKKIEAADSISLSVNYNPENVVIIWFDSNYWEVTNIWSQNEWMNTIIIQTDWKDIEKWSDLLDIVLTKTVITSEQLNLINVNFKDNSGEQYNLSTSWITF